MKKNLEIVVHREPFNHRFALLISNRDMETGNRTHVTNMTFKEHKPGLYVEPSLFLTNEQAQGLFDELWNAGLRPQDGTGNAGHIKALSNHLEDMRKLVFDQTVTHSGSK